MYTGIQNDKESFRFVIFKMTLKDSLRCLAYALFAEAKLPTNW